jgi:hypothetical protein
MRVTWWNFLSFIPKEKIVIWWAWGYDLYNRQSRGVEALIKIPLYKEITKKYIESTQDNIIERIKSFLKVSTIGVYYDYLRTVNMKRIDYFNPVLSIEYEMMRNIKAFRAKEFYRPESSAFYYSDTVNTNKTEGAVLFGNSASFTNNHLDVWHYIKKYLPEGKEVIVPLSYGDYEYATCVKKGLQADNLKINILTDFIPHDEYFKMFNRCSYAVYGVLRQEAMGNIYVALREGLKVFLYKDSIVYKHLLRQGYCIFAIEDIDESSFNVPLSLCEIEQNRQSALLEFKERTTVREQAISDIFDRINRNIIKQ